MQECQRTAITPPQRWTVSATMSHTEGRLRHEGALSGPDVSVSVCVCVCVCVCVWGRWNTDFISFQIMRLRTCHLREEFQLSVIPPQTSADQTQGAGAGHWCSSFFCSLSLAACQSAQKSLKSHWWDALNVGNTLLQGPHSFPVKFLLQMNIFSVDLGQFSQLLRSWQERNPFVSQPNSTQLMFLVSLYNSADLINQVVRNMRALS